MGTVKVHLSPEEYLRQEEVAEFKSEYRNGEVIPCLVEQKIIIVSAETFAVILIMPSRMDLTKPS